MRPGPMPSRRELEDSTTPLHPYTALWPMHRKLGVGAVAAIPLILLFALFAVLIVHVADVAHETTSGLLPVLFYIHVGAQFVTLLVFGHLMTSNPILSPRAKTGWSIAFLLFAPFTIPAYWFAHVWHGAGAIVARRRPDGRPPQVHVYDFDYEGRRSGTERRADGALVHHVDALG